MEYCKQEMEATLWENLPADLLLNILAKLPLRSLMRLRCVSKHWQSLISQREILALSRTSKCPLLAEPMLGVSYEGKQQSLEWATLNLQSKKWTSMPPYPEVVQKSSGESKMEFHSAGGLLFSLTSSFVHYTSTKCLVFNPLTGDTRELPEFTRDWMCGAFAHPVVDTEMDTYKLVMGDHEHWAKFDGNGTNCWEEGGIQAVGCLSSGTKGVRCKELLFFVVPTMRGKSDLATFDTKRNVWLDTFDYEQMAEVGYHLNNRGHSEHNSIFEWDGSLFLMTKMDGRVWELDLVSKSWNLRFEMPQQLLGEFEKIQDCIATGNSLCVVGTAKVPRYSSLYAMLEKQQGVWEKLPPCPYEKADRQSTFLFQPSLLSV